MAGVDLATLGIQIDSSQAASAAVNLDKLSTAAAKAAKEAVSLTAAKQAEAQATRDAAAQAVSSTQKTLAEVQAKKQLNQQQQTEATSGQKLGSLKGRYTQLQQYELNLTKQLAQQNADLATKQNAYQASVAESSQAQQMHIAALEALRAKYNPLFAASKQYEQELNSISEAQKLGALSANEAAAANENARIAFEGQSISGGKLASVTKLSTFELQQLGYQINDVVSSLAMGMSPFRILTQQGGQFVQIMQQSGKGPIALFSGLGSMIKKVMTPTVGLSIAVIGLGSAFAYLYERAIVAQKGLEASLAGIGAGAGVTAAQLDNMAQSAANSSKISISSARGIAEAYASTGHIVGSSIGELTKLTTDYAATTHQSTEDATKDLASIFSDLGTGIDTLAKKLGTISPAQQQYVKNLIASGEYQKAAKVALDAINGTLANHRDQLTLIGRAWQSAKTAASDYINSIFNVSDRSLELRIADLRQQALLAGAQGNTSAAAAANQQIMQLQNQLSDQRSANAKKAGAVQANQLAGAAIPGITGATGDYADLVTLQNNLNTINKVLSNQQALKATGLALSQVKDAQEAYTNAISTYLTPAQRAQRQTQLDIAALHAKTPAQKAAIAAQQQELDLAGQAVRSGTRQAQAAAAASTAYAQVAYQLELLNKQTQISIDGNIALAEAGDRYSAAALMAAAHTQALNENLSNGVNVIARQKKLFEESVSSIVASQQQQLDEQQRSADVTAKANKLVADGSLSYDKLNDYISSNIQIMQLEDLRKAAIISGNKTLIDQLGKMIEQYKTLTKEQMDNAAQSQANALLNPFAQDKATIGALQGRPGAGAAIAQTQLYQQTGSVLNQLGSNNPFGQATGAMTAFNIKDIKNQADQYKQILSDAAQSGIITAQQAADARVQIEQEATERIKDQYTNLMSTQVALGAQAFGSIADGLGDLVGKTSVAYKAIFAVSKAFTIAQATINMWRAISEAAALPFPANLPAIAQAAAQFGTILSSIGQISAAFATGGVDIRGPGTGTSDSMMARISAGESVMTAQATARNRDALIAMNNGATFNGGAVNISIEHDGSTNIDVQRSRDNRIRIIAKQVVEDAKQGIIGDAVGASVKVMPDVINQSSSQPRRRGI